jgi:hypothetical protein
MDTWVIGRANDGIENAYLLLFNIYNNNHKLFVDKQKTGSKIIKEYKTQINDNKKLKEWLKLMLTRDKINKNEIKKYHKCILNDRYDMKFVQVCLNSSCKQIISEHKHFVEKKGELKLLKINLLHLEQSIEYTKR